MFIKVTEKESGNRILINTDSIVSIIECDGFDYCRILLNVKDSEYILPGKERPLVYDVMEKNLAEIKEWKF